MVTLQEIADFTHDRQSNFRAIDIRLLNLTVHKFFDASNERVIDYDLVSYVSNSKLGVDVYDRVAIINIALNRLLGDDNYYFEELLKDNTFENMRDLATHVIF